MTAGLELLGITKRFGAKVALDEVGLTAVPAEIFGLTGPSGAGKTTLLRVASGLQAADAGRVRLAGRDVSSWPPQQRRVAVMFESYALYPHLTVYANIISPLQAPAHRDRYDAVANAQRVEEALALTEISALAQRRPAELSGGQKQRVALCRALVQDPQAFLLDEPLSHLDAKLRHTLRGAIRQRQVQRDAPTIWSSPDAMEVLAVSDRCAILLDGRIQQVGTPQEIYAKPANIAVARLLGDPAMNLLRGTLRRETDGLTFCHAATTITLGGVRRPALERSNAPREMVLGVRPTAIRFDPAEDGNAVEVYAVEPFGKYHIVTTRLGDDVIRAKLSGPPRLDSGDFVALRIEAGDLMFFDAATGAAM
jgi:multiple sugar transport system ATP-binding protein